MASIGDVVAKVTANITDFTAKMSQVVKNGSDSSSKVSKAFQGVGKAVAGVSKAIGAGVVVASTAIVATMKKSLDAYADYEQLVGGVQKLFGDASVDVIANADKAFRTAGMSANDYMETVTSFSSSLIAGLGGDTAKASEISNMAIQDMSDNANTFGTDIETLKTAYAGFAKGQFMLLDNLKTDYKGTQEEAARLINDTGVMGDAFIATAENVKNVPLDKVILAIHQVQEEMGIMGTTAKEASGTISGSINSMKGAWTNLLTSFASDDLDIMDKALKDFADSVGDVFKNLMNVIPNILFGLVNTVGQVFESIDISLFISQIMAEIPKVVQLAVTLVTSLVNGIKDNLPLIMESAMQIIDTLIRALIELLPLILEMGIELLVNLMQGLTETIPELIPLIVDMILLMVDTIVDNLPLIIQTGLEFIIALLMGITDAIPELIDYMPEIIESIVYAIIQLLPIIVILGIRIILELNKGIVGAIPKLVAMIPQILNAIAKGLGEGLVDMWYSGKELVAGLWEGMKDSVGWIKNKLKGWVGDVTQFVKKLFGIASPSKLMEDEVGLNIGSGIASGILKSISMVEDAMSDVDSAVSMAVSPNINPNIAGTGGINPVHLNIDMSGANISSPEVAQEYAEKIGDAIVGKLRTNRRSYV